MSTSKDFLFDHHWLAGTYPVADFINVTATSDIVCARDYRGIGFAITTGVVNTANGIVTMLVNTTNTTVGAVAVPFRYRVCASSTTVDTWGASTNATTAGFSMTATANYKYWCEILTDEISAALANASFVYLLITEVTNDPALGSIEVFGLCPRFPQAIPLTAIA